MKAEDELQQCQVEFANQVEVTQESMAELSHIQVDHLKHLTAFVQAQVEKILFGRKFETQKILFDLQEEYYANGHKVMQELFKDLWG